MAIRIFLSLVGPRVILQNKALPRTEVSFSSEIFHRGMVKRFLAEVLGAHNSPVKAEKETLGRVKFIKIHFCKIGKSMILLLNFYLFASRFCQSMGLKENSFTLQRFSIFYCAVCKKFGILSFDKLANR